MADVDTISGKSEQSNDTKDSDQTPVQLRFPTIALDTSFESLLSNSSTSSHDTTIMPPSSTSGPALDESWASLDASDFTQEDDVHSVTTDTGSLIDLSSAHDTESAAEDELQSDLDIDEDRATSMMVHGSAGNDEIDTQDEDREIHNEEALEETMILQRSEVQQHTDSINLEHTRTLRHTTQDTESSLVQEIVNMTIARSSLNIGSRPFNVAYYSAASAYDTKDELLGKIGAALVTSTSITTSRLSSTSPCFNIVPTEFGPGSKPIFADLIPSQAQMTVDDLTILKSQPKRPTSVKLALKNGDILESRVAQPHERSVISWHPDLLVVQVSKDDIAEDFHTVNEVLELANRHFWPTTIVTKEAADGLCPLWCAYPLITKTIKVQKQEAGHVQPIDLDTFIALDSDQLNRHIRYVIDQAQEKETEAAARTRPSSIFYKLARSFSLPGALSFRPTQDPVAGQARYILAMDEPVPEQVKIDKRGTSFIEQLQYACSALQGQQGFREVSITFIVMLLGLYVVSLFQGRTSQGLIRKNMGCVSYYTNVAPLTATVTAVAASEITPIPTTHVPSINHDVMVYEPISFDQMWQFWTGKAADRNLEQENPSVEGVPEDKVHEDRALTSDSIYEILRRNADACVERSKAIHETAQHQLDQIRANYAIRRQLRKDTQDQIQEMHKKVQDLWSDVSNNVHDVGKQTRVALESLIKTSERHLKSARWAGKRRLERLLEEQKEVLGRAQGQAQLLAHQMPQRKKRSFFGKT